MGLRKPGGTAKWVPRLPRPATPGPGRQTRRVVVQWSCRVRSCESRGRSRAGCARNIGLAGRGRQIPHVLPDQPVATAAGGSTIWRLLMSTTLLADRVRPARPAMQKWMCLGALGIAGLALLLCLLDLIV